MTHGMNEDMLVRQARAVLDFKWTGGYTMPGPRLYPHQWSWDSAFIAIGYSRYDQDRATRELRHLLEAQWKNGLLPQLVFNPHFTKHICTRIFLNLSSKSFIRFANSCYLSMWDEPVGSRADRFRRSQFARSSHLASAEFGFHVRVRSGLFITHASDIGVRCHWPYPRACSPRDRPSFLLRRPRPVELRCAHTNGCPKS